MVTQEKLKEYISKAKKDLVEAVKEAKDNKNGLNTRTLRKKFKRLTRKNKKIDYAKKKASEKGQKKKEGV